MEQTTPLWSPSPERMDAALIDDFLQFAEDRPAEFTPLRIAREGITFVPSIIYHHPTDFKRTIRLIQRKVVTPSNIISSFVPLDGLQTALEKAASGDESKIVVTV